MTRWTVRQSSRQHPLEHVLNGLTAEGFEVYEIFKVGDNNVSDFIVVAASYEPDDEDDEAPVVTYTPTNVDADEAYPAGALSDA